MTNETALRDAVRNVLSHRVGELPDKGYIRDTDISRAAIDQMARLLQSPSQPVVADNPVQFATVRDGGDEWHIECRFKDGQKFAAVTVDKDHDDLADWIANALSATHPQASPPPVQSEHIAEVLLASACSTGPFAHESATIIRGTEWVRKSKALQAIRAAIGSAGRLAHSQTDTQEGEVEAHEIDDIIEAAISEGMEEDDWTAFSIARRVHEGLAHNGLAVTAIASPQRGDAAQQQEQQP